MHGSKRKICIGLAILCAIIAIAIGSVMVWQSFKAFDTTFINDKDNQFAKLIHSQDSSLEIGLTGFTRETDAWFGRQKIMNANRKWLQQGDALEMESLIASFTGIDNDIYAGMAVYQHGNLVQELSSEKELSFITKPDEKNFAICISDDGIYFLAYRVAMPEFVEYYVLVDLKNLLNSITGEEQSSEDMTFMIDDACSVMLYQYGDMIDVIAIDEATDDNIDSCRKYILDCQAAGISDAQSIEVANDGEEPYTARMLVRCTADTNNGLFAIGMTTNYDATLGPSRRAASRILVFGGVVVIGVAMLLVVLILMRRINTIELENMRKRNETLKEINREMHELAHHQRLETIGTMTAGIAHDFNNLLTPIMGYSMMTMEMLPENAGELQENLLEVYNASVKAKDIVTQLANLTKCEDEESFEELNPDEVIQSAIKVTMPVKPESVNIEMNLNCSDCRIRGDRTQISQLIMNLTLNAYDAMSEQGGEYHVLTCYEEGKVIMKFSDNGVGMNAETVAKIFDPFFTTKGAGKGTGLGLAIVAHVAETHGAKVYIDSELGVGTEFTVVLDSVELKETVH